MGDFSKFKPICVELLKTPSVERLVKLKSLVTQSEDESIQQLQEYILFPLFIIASNEELRYKCRMLLPANLNNTKKKYFDLIEMRNFSVLLGNVYKKYVGNQQSRCIKSFQTSCYNFYSLSTMSTQLKVSLQCFISCLQLKQ
jgi:hypothetical protein